MSAGSGAIQGKPRLLDLFCGAGGAGMGYTLAGFEVVGVDINDQPHYPFEFRQADALYVATWANVARQEYDAIHASPPCEHYAAVTKWRGEQGDHPDLIGPTRELLEATGLPYVIENVREAPIRSDFMLCGTSFGLPIRRHRHFETNWSGLVMSTPCQHQATDLPFEHKQERAYADAMRCFWMSNREARDAIPPAYTEHIGSMLLSHLREEVAA